MLLCRTNGNSPASPLPTTFIYHLRNGSFAQLSFTVALEWKTRKITRPTRQATVTQEIGLFMKSTVQLSIHFVDRKLTGLSFKVDHSGMIFKDLKTNTKQQSQ